MEKKWKKKQTMPRCFFWKGVLHVTVTYQLFEAKKRISTFISAIPVPVDRWSTGMCFQLFELENYERHPVSASGSSPFIHQQKDKNY